MSKKTNKHFEKHWLTIICRYSGKMVYADIVFNPLSFENGPSKPGIQEGPKKSQKWISQTASKRQLKIAFFGIFDNFGAY